MGEGLVELDWEYLHNGSVRELSVTLAPERVYVGS